MRALIVISRGNEASQNIKRNLLSLVDFEAESEGFWSSPLFDMAEYDGNIVDIVPAHDADYYIYASTHKSESKLPNFTAHTPGNWGRAMLGGNPRCLNVSYGSKIRAAVLEMKRLSEASLGWPSGIEVDHHGPTIGKPLLFVEIGSSGAEWGNEKAGEIAARGIIAAVKSDDAADVKIGFGGSHYCPKFLPMVLSGSRALGHIIPGYALERDGIDDEMVSQAMGRNVENASGAILDWKGIKGEARGKLISVLEGMGVGWEKA